MRPAAAPRIDDRLRRFIAGAGEDESAAHITRLVGGLADDLALTRPSYQQVRVHLLDARERPGREAFELDRATALRLASRALGAMYEYPGPGLANWYRHSYLGL